MVKPLVIIGTGLAGYTLAREWRKLNPEHPLVMLSRDDGCFYSKPMLSNALATGKSPQQLATFSAAQMADQLHATIFSHTQVLDLDVHRSEIKLQREDGRQEILGFAQLVLALGAEPVILPLAGDGVTDVIAVNDLRAYQQFRQTLTNARSVLVLGAGFVGCEFANDLSIAGYEVTMADPAPYPLNRFLPEPVGQGLGGALRGIGINYFSGYAAREVIREAGKLHVTLSDAAGHEQQVVVDLVLSAVGLRPCIALARAAGLQVDRGIVTNAYLQSSHENIFALGDCAELDGMVRPFVMPVMHGARALARTLTGTATPVVYPVMPIALKTPAYPLMLAAADPGVAGEWLITTEADGVKALYLDGERRLRGFALGGTATREKAELIKQMQAVD